jgi:serine/threonine protein kinase
MAEGIKALKEMRIVHRDIKPSNIIYSIKAKAYKISDLGEAKII